MKDEIHNQLVQTLLASGGLHNPEENAPIISNAILAFALGNIIDQMLMVLPDDIEFYRMLRHAGRRDAKKAEVLAAHFEPVRQKLTALRDSLPSEQAS